MLKFTASLGTMKLAKLFCTKQAIVILMPLKSHSKLHHKLFKSPLTIFLILEKFISNILRA